ncbi:MAG: type I-B CRISPR-associated protein Cas7/Csh2 [Candidatus Caldarchaeum sp.]
MTNAEIFDTNSEILLIYEAKMCNPNGDPDDENRPRIDRKTEKNLVSDVRLKRFFRNYIIDRYGEEFIWVSKVEGQPVRADERFKMLSKDLNPDDVLKKCIDARLFGATIPIGGEDKDKGSAKSFTGPLQFSWGYSLHPVELVESSTITSMFMGREVGEEAERYGTIGKDWRVHYSLIAFYGVINGLKAKATKARPLDIQIFDNLLYKSINLDATTRSKIGHWTHLYLRIEYKNPEFLMGDLRKFLVAEFDKDKPIRSFEDLSINFEQLLRTIREKQDFIRHVFVYEEEECKRRYDISRALRDILGDRFAELPHDINVNRDVLKL